MKQTKRVIGLLLAVVMLLSMVPVSFANKTAEFPDFPTGWSKEAMTAAVNNGLLNGYEDGKIHPEAKLTRAQFAAIMARAFGAKTKANISDYKDVSRSAWYYDDIAKAVKMGALKGQSTSSMAPDANITRQEVFTAFARILVLSDDDTSALAKFNDEGEIASWAANHMAALTKRGYVNGDPQGDVNPKANISREEFAQLMHNAIRTYITKPGTYTEDLEGITVVRVGDVTLKGFKNTSDLVIGDGAGEGNIRIEEVTIDKRLLARGGTIRVLKSTLGDFVVVNNVNGITKFQNYRDEKFFKGIVENTEAQFLKRPSGTSSPSVPDTVYTLTLKVDGTDYATVTVTNGKVTGYPGDPTKDYYTFDGWYDGTGKKVTDFSTVDSDEELTAKFTANLYTVNFAGTPAFTWADGFVPVTQFTDETGFDLPSKDNIVAPLGYTFEYWKLNGVKVDSLEAIKESGYLPKTESATITIEAHLVLKQYKIVYEGVVWDPNYTPVLEYNILTVDSYILPTTGDFVTMVGEEFRYWKNKATGATVGKLTITEETPDVLTLVPHFVPFGTPDEVYTLTLKVDGSVYETVVVTNGVPDKSVADPVKDYYTFDGWFDGSGHKVVDFGSVKATQDLNAKFTAIKYDVTFTGTPAFEWATGFDPITDFTVDELTTKELPASDKIVVPLGYTFEYWKVNGNRVDSLTDIKTYLPTDKTATITIEAEISVKTYNVAYEGVTWKTGYTPVLTYDITNVDAYVLPDGNDVVAPANQEFRSWKNKATGATVGKLTITEETPDLITLVPHFVDIGTPDEIYTLTLKVDGAVYETVTVTNGVPDKTVSDPQKDYYTFDGWFDSLGNKVTDFGSVDSDKELTAKFTAIVYTVSYVWGGSESPVPFVPGYNPPTSFTVETGLELPSGDKIDFEYYQTFLAWAYKAQRVEDLDDILALGINKTASETIKIQLANGLKRYKVEYVNVTFVEGYTPEDEYTINSAPNIQLPTADKISNVPAGMEFKYWKDENGNKVTALTVIESTPDVLKLFPHYEPIGTTPDEVYTLTLNVDGELYDTVTVTNGVPDKTVADPQKDYYTFDGWYDGAGNKVTDFGVLPATLLLNAKFTAIKYDVVFTGTPAFTWVDGFAPISDFTVEELTAKELPAKENIVAPLGYTFEYWKIDGNRVDSLTAIKDGGYLPKNTTTTLTIEAHYVLKQYTVAYEDVEWNTGYKPVSEYNILTVGTYTLPTKDNVVAPTDYEFKYWKNKATGARVDALSITAETPDVITLVPHFELIPLEPVTVTFYNRYSTVRKIGEATVENGETVDKNDFPVIKDAWIRKGYEETEEIASVYAGNEYTHTIVPEFWYVKDGVMTPFDETVEVYEDTNVYLLSKNLSLMMMYELNGTDQVLSVSADYNKDTRVMNSIKDIFAKSGRDQLELALATGMIPNYDELTGKVFDKMESTGLLKVDGNEKKIQIVKVPFKISAFVKEEVANGMIRTYLRDVVKNPAELDKIFTMIDVATFADQLGIDTIIANMSDAEIASLMKSSEHKGEIIRFVYSDLQKSESSMMNFVIDYVTNDANFRDKIIDQIIAELKDATKTSTLKTKALEYIEQQIKDSSSAFYAKFVDMIKTDLQSSSSVVMDAVVSYLRTNLKADTQEGKDLRKEILTNTELLKQFLANDIMKEEIIKLILKDAFIDKALDNVDFRTVLVEAVMDDDDFIDLLLASKEFHDYIIDQLHPVEGNPSAHPLAKDVEDLIQDEDSKFRQYVLDLVKASTAFTGLFTTHPELKTVVLNELDWSDFVASDDDFLKYAFCQSGAPTYSFVSKDEIDAKIAEKYNALSDIEKIALTGNDADWNNLSNDDKQKVRDELYGNAEAQAEVLNEAKSKFNSYKANIVDKITQGKFSEITDETALKLIDELLVDYVTKYIEQEELNADPEIDASIAGVIEEILFGFISDLIHNHGDFDEDGTVDEGIESEISAMIGHIDSIKHQFVIDPTPEVIARLKVIVKNYRDAHADNIKSIIETNYTSLTDKLISLIDPDATNSVYSDVEAVLISVADTIDAKLIKDYIKDIDEADKTNGTTKLEDLIKKYIKKVTVADINNYIAAFLYDSVNDTENTANVATVRTEIESFVGDADQADTVKEMAVTYITDPLNETTIKDAISEFIDDIDETFVNTNRSIIEEAIKSIDVTAFVDEQFIKDYINGLDESKGEKTAFADQIYETLQNNNDYKTFMNQLLKGDSIVVNKENASMVTAISGAIRALSFESVIEFIDNAAITKLMNTVGSDFVKKYYNEMLKDYCDGLDAVIKEVNDSSSESIEKSYTTSLTFKLNVFTIYDKLYEKAIEKAVSKLENLDLYYNENPYLKFLVEHDILSYILNGDLSLADGDFSGYSLKAEMDYYDYLVMLLIVGDDALTWYGDEVNGLSDEQLDALYNAAFDKIFFVHEKVNEILEAFAEDGTLPAKIQNAVNSVSQLNSLILKYGETGKSLINRYLDSNINIKFEDESIAGEEKVLKLVDFIVGNDDPVINIDSVYAMLFTFNDKIQSKLEAVVETDKFKAAVDKFESTSFGELFDGKGKLGTVGDKLDELKNNGRIESALDSLYDMFYLLAYEGIDAFKVPASETEITDIEIFEIKVGKITMEVRREYK